MSQLTTQEAELQALCQKTASSSSFKELEGLVKLPRNMLDHISCSWDEQQRPKDFNHCEQLVAGETSDLLVCVCSNTITQIRDSQLTRSLVSQEILETALVLFNHQSDKLQKDFLFLCSLLRYF